VASAASPNGRRTGRPSGSPPNREAILASARQQFIEHGYDGATIRGIAAGADVDAALVHHYFGTKERLLLTSLQESGPAQQAVEGHLGNLVAAGTDGLGERLIRATFEVYGSLLGPGWGSLVSLLRSAATREDAAGMLREGFARGGLAQLIRALDVPQPQVRMALIGSELVGLAMARFVIRLEPVASADIDSLVAWYAPTLQRYLTEPLPGDEA